MGAVTAWVRRIRSAGASSMSRPRFPPETSRVCRPTVLDSSAVGLQTLLVSGGKRGLDIELAPVDLIRLTQAVTAPIGSLSN